jgi:thymidylate synthase ThyX
MSYDVKVIADSIYNKDRITTLECTYPRYIHSEMMTHRAFSRNAQSSRAVPIEKMLERVERDPVMPMWTENQKGMQGAELRYDGDAYRSADLDWLEARDAAVRAARCLIGHGIHKQNVNRLLEPFSWITVLITATDWDNFFQLRVNPAAQPEMYKIAELMFDAIDFSDPKYQRKHLPYITDYDREHTLEENLPRISAARCARISYLTHDGQRDLAKDLDLSHRLLQDKHLSPFEHIASARHGRYANFVGWQSYRNQLGY